MKDPLYGQLIGDGELERFEAAPARVSHWRGQRVALFCFSSWALGRGQLPLWQALKRRMPHDAQVVGIAAEVEGERWLRGYLRQAGVEFPVLIDRKNALGGQCGFKAGPNVVLVNEDGSVIWRRLYDASLRKAHCRDAIERYLAHGEHPEPMAPDATYAPDPAAQEAFGDAVDLFLAGEVDRCREPWNRSIAIDPEHWISQEQLWVLQAPERFHPWIDVQWQNAQLAAQGRPTCACDLESGHASIAEQNAVI